MHKPRLCDSQNTPFWVCLNCTMRDASRVGKIRSYYLVAFVFSFFLYPDNAGRVAPIRACVWWQSLVVALCGSALWLRLVLEETQALMGATRLASGKEAAII